MMNTARNISRKPFQQLPLGLGARDQQISTILESLKDLHRTTSDLAKLIHSRDQDLELLTDSVIDIRGRLPRREFPAWVKRAYCEISLLRFDGRCLICPHVRIVDSSGNSTEEAEFDHWISHSDISIDAGWIVSKEANRGVLRHNRQHYRPEFEIFQRELKAYLQNGSCRRPLNHGGVHFPRPMSESGKGQQPLF